MIVYLDASALVKRYVAEHGSRETGELSASAEVVATSLVSRAEVAAALAKAVRRGILGPESGRKAQRAFASQWPDIAKVPVTEALVLRAEALGLEHSTWPAHPRSAAGVHFLSGGTRRRPSDSARWSD